MEKVSKAVKRGYHAVFGGQTEEPEAKRANQGQGVCGELQNDTVLDNEISKDVSSRHGESQIDAAETNLSGAFGSEGARDGRSLLRPDLNTLPTFVFGSGNSADFDWEGGEPSSMIVAAMHKDIRQPPMLMTEDLLGTLELSVEASRASLLEAQKAQAKQQLLDQFQEWAQQEVEQIPDRWQALEDVPDAVAGMQALELQSKTLKRKLHTVQEEQAEIKRSLDSAQQRANLEQLKLNMLLHGVLENAGLLESDEDVEALFEPETSFVERYAVSDASRKISKPQSIDQHPQRPVLDREEFDNRRQDLSDARARHDAHERSVQAAKGDHTDANLADLQQGMRLTSKVIEAEERFREAKDAAIAKGIDIATSDQTSGFGDSDGQAQHPPIGPINCPHVEMWLETLPEMIDPNRFARGFLDAIDAQCEWKVEVPELDDWSTGPAVLMKDSISIVAQGRAKARIESREAIRELDRSTVKKHWAEQNPRGLSAEQWDRAHRVFEVGR